MNSNDKQTAIIAEMTEAITTARNGNGYRQKVYKDDADGRKAQALREDIAIKIEQLEAVNGRQKVDWQDLNLVKERTIAYFRACEKAACIPSVMGLAVYGFGVDRGTLNEFIRRYPETNSARFLLAVKDVIADVLTNAALNRRIDNVMSIFQLKNGHGFRDSVEIQAATETPIHSSMSPEDIEAQLADLPD